MGNGTFDGRAGTFRRVDDFAGRLVDQTMIESLQADPYILVCHKISHALARNCYGVEATPSVKGCGILHLTVGDRYYAITLATTPAPTVLPPSRMAKRRPCSIAIGAISSTTILMLSPGITISVPSGNSTAPVTSVVRK
jgi:hypothetical protein